MIREPASAKVNLCLHVTGRRADGYHLLDSIVVFAAVGDVVTAEAAPALSLAIRGPMVAGLDAGDDNLVLRAARAFGADRGARLGLEKHLPVASGIGGGSADAAAALRALARLWGQPLPGADAVLALGADVPVCLNGRAVRMQGVGEVLSPLPPLPRAWLVLANPRQGVSTPAVFRALKRRDHPALPALPGGFADTAALAGWLQQTRNDLEPAAENLLPVIGQVRAALAAQPGCLLARMSGSGATCFGLFGDEPAARAAEAALQQTNPGWWLASGAMLS